MVNYYFCIVADSCSRDNNESVDADTSVSSINKSPGVKIEPDEDGEHDHGESSDLGECGCDGASLVTWIKVQDISLTLEDKLILQHGKKLTDKHINYTQRILKLKFPSINGLRLTVLQNKSHKQSTSNAIQIFHVNEDHWVCVTTIGTARKEVLVYDSWYTKWDKSTISMFTKQFRCNTHSIKVLKKVQKQQGRAECGLYAIANATSIAYERDPSQLVYCEKEMRQHLVNCFSQNDLEPFPLINEECDNPRML